MSKKKKKTTNYKFSIPKEQIPLLTSFLLPLIITVIICIDHGVYPFGDRCLLQVDMYHQYCPFFTEFADKLKTGGSLMYSWTVGLGSDFVSLYAYYLASVTKIRRFPPARAFCNPESVNR